MRCDFCDQPAVVHEVTVKGGVRKEVHLCVAHAKQAGIDIAVHQPINQLLTQFVLQQGQTTSKVVKKACPSCGMTWSDFRHGSLLGCAECYEAFEQQLSPLVERAQGGAVHHAGKTPRRRGGSIDRQLTMRKLIKEIDDAVAAEQYERAAQLRDRLNELEREPSPPDVAPKGPGAAPPSPGAGAGARAKRSADRPGESGDPRGRRA